jgi:hypothetical protein
MFYILAWRNWVFFFHLTTIRRGFIQFPFGISSAFPSLIFSFLWVPSIWPSAIRISPVDCSCYLKLFRLGVNIDYFLWTRPIFQKRLIVEGYLIAFRRIVLFRHFFNQAQRFLTLDHYVPWRAWTCEGVPFLQ